MNVTVSSSTPYMRGPLTVTDWYAHQIVCLTRLPMKERYTCKAQAVQHMFWLSTYARLATRRPAHVQNDLTACLVIIRAGL